MMKKRALFAALLLIVSLLCGCGKELFTCELCGREVNERPHQVSILGQEAKICDDCNDSIQELKDALS